MKTSKKLLITTLGVFIAMLVTGLTILRGDLKIILSELNAEYDFRQLELGEFDKLDFSENWNVRILAGRDYAVQIVSGKGNEDTRVINQDRKLFFTSRSQEPTLVRITLPTLREIKAIGNTAIHIQDYKTDSLMVILEDSSLFVGKENVFTHVRYKVSGNATVELIDDPNK